MDRIPDLENLLGSVFRPRRRGYKVPYQEPTLEELERSLELKKEELLDDLYDLDQNREFYATHANRRRWMEREVKRVRARIKVLEKRIAEKEA